MAGVYFTATKSDKTARIVVPTSTQAAQLKTKLESKGVKCGAVFELGANFERDKKEERVAIAFLNMVL